MHEELARVRATLARYRSPDDLLGFLSRRLLRPRMLTDLNIAYGLLLLTGNHLAHPHAVATIGAGLIGFIDRGIICGMLLHDLHLSDPIEWDHERLSRLFSPDIATMTTAIAGDVAHVFEILKWDSITRKQKIRLRGVLVAKLCDQLHHLMTVDLNNREEVNRLCEKKELYLKVARESEFMLSDELGAAYRSLEPYR